MGEMWYNIIYRRSSGSFGGVAQLGERTVRIRKVESSILFVSTKKNKDTFRVSLFFFMQKGMERTLEKATAFSQVLRAAGWISRTWAQNRSSDPLRLHQKEQGHL